MFTWCKSNKSIYWIQHLGWFLVKEMIKTMIKNVGKNTQIERSHHFKMRPTFQTILINSKSLNWSIYVAFINVLNIRFHFVHYISLIYIWFMLVIHVYYPIKTKHTNPSVLTDAWLRYIIKFCRDDYFFGCEDKMLITSTCSIFIG